MYIEITTYEVIAINRRQNTKDINSSKKCKNMAQEGGRYRLGSKIGTKLRLI